MSSSSPFMSSSTFNQPSTSSQPKPISSLSSLLAQANSLNATAQNGSELPQLRFGLDEIERMSESVGGKGKARRGRDGEGHTLLSSLGVNTSQLAHSISALPQGSTNDHAFPRPKRRRRQIPSSIVNIEANGQRTSNGDIESWGRNWHEMVILGGIEAQRQKTMKAFQAQFQQRMLQNWEDEKAKILQDELGITEDEITRLSSTSNGFGQSSLGRSGLGSSTRRFPMAQSTSKSSSDTKEGGLVMHTKMMRYAQIISELNHKRLAKQPMEICQAFEESVKGDSKQPLLPTTYHILAHLVQEPSLMDASAGHSHDFIGERQYAHAYLGDQKSNQARLLKERLVNGGKRFLERDFENHMDETIAKHPKEAALGGIPGIKNKIRAYVDVLLRSKESQDSYKPELVDGTPLFAQVYYLLRSGYATEALDLLGVHQNSLKSHDLSLPGALKSYLTSADRKLPKNIKDQLFNDFNSHIRNNPSIDQFKYALYKLIGRFELNKKNVKVAATTEDWMWFQLALVREYSGNEGVQDKYDLNDLGSLVRKHGSEKFDENGRKPLSWVNLLLFTGQFERSVAYLWSKSALRTDAVHFGIALAYYALIKLPPKGEDTDLLIHDETPFGETTYLSFYRLIKTYIAQFFKLEPQMALQYAYIVALGSDAPGDVGERQKGYALELIRDIVVGSGNWGRLLGHVRSDGIKEPGMIEKNLPLLRLRDPQQFIQTVILTAADSTSSLIDSIELYHLASDYPKVLDSINKALGLSLSSSTSMNKLDGPRLGLSGAFGGVSDIYQLSERVYEIYGRDMNIRNRVRRESWDCLEVLLKLRKGMREFEGDRPDLALETFQSTGILPLDDSSQSSLNRSSSKFTQLLDQPVISNLDQVIITTMKCLHILSQNLKNSPYGDQSRQDLLIRYKNMAMSLMMFTSGIRLRLGGDVYRQLSSMSAFF